MKMKMKKNNRIKKEKFSLKDWWRMRHFRRVKKNLIHLGNQTQLGFAQSIIASQAVPFPRSRRKQFLALQYAKIEELVKGLVVDNKTSR